MTTVATTESGKINLIDAIKEHLSNFREKTAIKMEFLNDKELAAQKNDSVAEDEINYKRTWTKLSSNQRRNRLMLYHRHLIDSYKLKDEEQEQLRILFFELANSTILEGKDIVNYDVNDGIILGIAGLKKSETGEFYLASSVKRETTVAPVVRVKAISTDVISKMLKNNEGQPPKPSTSKPEPVVHRKPVTVIKKCMT